MEQKEALILLIRGIMLAQKRGAYELREAEMLSQAVKTFSDDQYCKNELISNNNQSNISKSNKEDNDSFVI